MDSEKYNLDKIRKIEVRSFIKEWNLNTKEEIPFYANDFSFKCNLTQSELHSYNESILESFLCNSSTYKIIGYGIVKGFQINITNKDALFKVCQDIWDNPQNYCNSNDYVELPNRLLIEGFNDDISLRDVVMVGYPPADEEASILITKLKQK